MFFRIESARGWLALTGEPGVGKKGTRVLLDDHYRCPKCLREKPARKQEEKDWDV